MLKTCILRGINGVPLFAVRFAVLKKTRTFALEIGLKK